MNHRPSAVYAALIFALALAVRGAFLPWVANLPLAGDEKYYWKPPGGFSRGYMGHDSITLQAPLWGLVMRGLKAVPFIPPRPLAGRALAALLGACVPPLVYALAVRVRDRRTGIVAGLLMVFVPEHLAFSHYLWTECMLSVFTALAAWLVFLFIDDPRRVACLYGGALAAGLALITKEYAVFIAAGLLLALARSGVRMARRESVAACALFLFPAAAYSLAISCVIGRAVFVSDGSMYSFRLAAGLDSLYDFSLADRKRQWAELFRALGARAPGQFAAEFRAQLCNLWSPNSFPIVRLLGLHDPESWSYGLDQAAAIPVARGVVACTIAVTAAGLAGLCLGPAGSFRAFSIAALLGLSLSSAFTWQTSRYRIAFLFIVVIHAAWALTHPGAALSRARSPWRAAALATLLAVFAAIVYSRAHTLGSWG